VNGTAIVTLSNPGAILATALAGELPACDLFLHRGVSRRFRGERFDAVVDFTRGIFGRYRNLIYIMPAGVVVRAIDGLPRHKTADPAVVVVDAAGRYAISLLSGHEGGANGLALRVANILAAEPVISTTTEALKDLIVGVGCRRNANAGDIVMAIKTVLRQARLPVKCVRLLASADIKKNETGLLAAADQLGLGLRFISSGEIRATTKHFNRSHFVSSKVKLPAVAEPSALLAGRRTQLLIPKTIINHVTIAVARENSLSLASDPADDSIAPAARKKPLRRARSSSATLRTSSR
jgi:cobalt-precorrin 5A hydrolase